VALEKDRELFLLQKENETLREGTRDKEQSRSRKEPSVTNRRRLSEQKSRERPQTKGTTQRGWTATGTKGFGVHIGESAFDSFNSVEINQFYIN
jgi:hypothetical protein